MYFANVSWFRELLNKYELKSPTPVKGVVLDATGINFVDSTGAQTLTEVVNTFQSKKIHFLMANVKGRVRDALEKLKLTDLIGSDNFFISTHDAVSYLKAIIQKEGNLEGGGGEGGGFDSGSSSSTEDIKEDNGSHLVVGQGVDLSDDDSEYTEEYLDEDSRRPAKKGKRIVNALRSRIKATSPLGRKGKGKKRMDRATSASTSTLAGDDNDIEMLAIPPTQQVGNDNNTNNSNEALDLTSSSSRSVEGSNNERGDNNKSDDDVSEEEGSD